MDPAATPTPAPTRDERSRGVRILASSLFRELTSQGYSTSHVVGLTTELLALLTDAIRRTPAIEGVPGAEAEAIAVPEVVR